MRSRQRGLSGGLVAVILLIIAGVLVGAQVVSRVVSASRGEAQVQARMANAAQALQQYVAANQRLPCPADPAADTGDEVLPAPNAATCSFPQGTVPWKTIGLARGESIDTWGQKISYRVYTGTAGSLTQARRADLVPPTDGGASMIQCDTVDSAPAAATAVSGSLGGLCRPDTRVTFRNTSPANFLAGKGLSVNDAGTLRTDVAYVLVSHGASGLGAYTASGVQRDQPAAGSELANTGATGATDAVLCPATPCFVIKAFSAAGTDPATAAHFDDLVVYRRIDELIRAAGVHARDWPEEATSTTTFDKPTVEAAVGHSVTAGQGVGQVTINFTGVVASGLDTGGTAQEITYVEVGGTGGLGVAGGGSALVQSTANERLRLDVEKATKFGVTLGDLGTYGAGPYAERVDVRFYLAGVQVGPTRIARGCRADGGLATFSANVGAVFDRIEFTAVAARNLSDFSLSGITAFYLSELKTCASTDATCTTPAAGPSTNCTLF